MSDASVPVILNAYGIPVSSGRKAEPFENGVMKNGLGDAIGYFSPFGLPPGGGPQGPTISQFTGVFDNLRWYMVSNYRQALSQAYVEIGLVQTICDIPVDDGLRGGVEIKSEQLDEDQIKELDVSLDRDDDINTVGQAAKWNRLFGGAGIIVLTDQAPEEPLNIEAIGPDTPVEFRSADLWELFWNKQNEEGYDPSTQIQDFEYYDYYGEQVHKSRVMRLKGLTAPSFIRPRLRGWGFSVVEILVRSINQYLKATNVAFEVMDEFKIDVYKIKGLVNALMSPQGTQAVQQRLQMANFQKNYQHALIMSEEDEWDHKQLNFSGIAEMMLQIRMQVASDMRMPLTKLFGISATGFNSGEDDIEVYNAMVESQVRNKIKYTLLRIIEIKCQKMFGFVPDDLAISFKPLRVLSAEQEENVKTQKFTRALQATQAGLLPADKFADVCNRGNLFDVKLDPDEIGDFMADTVGEGANDPSKPKDTDDPGADRADGHKGNAAKDGGIPKGGGKPVPVKSDAPEAKAKATRTGNSAAFDRASYAADGGDAWIDPRRKELFTNPKNKGLWAKAREASLAAFDGQERWQFCVWIYDKMGGTW